MNDTALEEDKLLLKKIKDGNDLAFGALFEKYAKRLFGIARLYLNDRSACEEIVQEVFLKIWLNREKLQPDLPFIPYISRIAKNLIINGAKRKILQISYLNSLGSNDNKNINSTQQHVIFTEVKTLIDQLVAAFPPKRKEIFTLSRFKGLSNKEIATRMQISERTVEGQINKALKSLRQQLGRHGYLGIFFILFSSLSM